MAAAHVREACTIPGTSSRTAFLCRDKPAMKEVLRAAGVPCAASTGASSVAEVEEFVAAVGFPVILKPRDAAGASGTHRADDPEQLAAAIRATGVDRGAGIAVEEFIEGHEGFYDTISIDGQVVHEFVSHYFPNVLDAMRHRWISPQFIATNRVDEAGVYDEVKALGRTVNEALGIGTSATHMEWFFGPKGLEVLRDRLPAAGRAGVGPVRRRQRHRHLPRVGDGRRARPAVAAAVAPLRRRDHRPATRPRRRHRRLRGIGRGATAVRRMDHRPSPPAGRDADPAGRGRIHGQRVDPPQAPRLRSPAVDARPGRPDGPGPRAR